MGSLDWGDVPTWLGGIFAALAAYGAISTMRSQRRQIDEQRQFIRMQTALLELDHRDRTWAQALGITVETDERKYLKGRYWRVVVRNGGPAPVFDVDVTFDDEQPDYRWDGSGDALTRYGLRSLRRHASGLRVRLEQGGALVVTSPDWRRGDPRKERPTVEFTDAAHVRWRLKDGELTKLGPVNGDDDG